MHRTRARVGAVLATAVSGLAVLAAAPPASAAPPSEVLIGGAVYNTVSYLPGKFTLQANRYRAIFQTDGNFVVYYLDHPLWSSGTVGKGAQRLSLQKDCNIVIYGSSNRVLWTTRTACQCGEIYARLVMQTDGNLVEYQVYDYVHDKAIWNSNSVFH